MHMGLRAAVPYTTGAACHLERLAVHAGQEDCPLHKLQVVEQLLRKAGHACGFDKLASTARCRLNICSQVSFPTELRAHSCVCV